MRRPAPRCRAWSRRSTLRRCRFPSGPIRHAPTTRGSTWTPTSMAFRDRSSTSAATRLRTSSSQWTSMICWSFSSRRSARATWGADVLEDRQKEIPWLGAPEESFFHILHARWKSGCRRRGRSPPRRRPRRKLQRSRRQGHRRRPRMWCRRSSQRLLTPSRRSSWPSWRRVRALTGAPRSMSRSAG